MTTAKPAIPAFGMSTGWANHILGLGGSVIVLGCFFWLQYHGIKSTGNGLVFYVMSMAVFSLATDYVVLAKNLDTSEKMRIFSGRCMQVGSALVAVGGIAIALIEVWRAVG